MQPLFLLKYCTKIILAFLYRYNAAVGDDEKKRNRFTSETMLVLASILHLGRSGLPAKKITPDDGDRIALCLKVLAEQSPAVVEIFDRWVEIRGFLRNSLLLFHHQSSCLICIY